MKMAWSETTQRGWSIGNSQILLEFENKTGGLALASLCRLSSETSRAPFEWALRGSPAGPLVLVEGAKEPVRPEDAGFVFESGQAGTSTDGAAELVVVWRNQTSRAVLSLSIRCFPDTAALEWTGALENRGSVPLPLVLGLWPLGLVLGQQPKNLRVLSADPKGRHGFYDAGPLVGTRSFDNWLVLDDATSKESLLVGGELGNGILKFGADTAVEGGGLTLRAGTNFPEMKEGKAQAFQVMPGQTAQLPLQFLALAEGGADHVGNEAFRYLRRHVMLEPVEGTPLAACCVWLTDPDVEELLESELAFAKRIGFDVFYHDAGWYEGSSLVPGMNDWALGAGSYEEHHQKFPNGLARFSEKVRATGMKFGLWVDPGNVDRARVLSGEIPEAWLAKRGGKNLECHHPSLSVMTQLCLGNPDVVAWVIKNVAGIVERYGLDWIKWDPSGTVTHACDRADHGHGTQGGSWAAWEGRGEILSALLAKYPDLIGFECDPSLRHCRTNPGPRTLLPGGYQNEFMTGPMVGPYVWGSMATVRTTDASEIREITSGWCTASTLDYSIRQHLKNGIAFGNINGQFSQLLSRAPSGYIEAFKRNLHHFKSYRHLLLQNVWHPELADSGDWQALLYTSEDLSEAVLFAFRHRGGKPTNSVKLAQFPKNRKYVLSSLNERPGRERIVSGSELASKGLEFELPNAWLAKGDGFPGSDYDSQLEFGSDILLLRQVAGEIHA